MDLTSRPAAFCAGRLNPQLRISRSQTWWNSPPATPLAQPSTFRPSAQLLRLLQDVSSCAGAPLIRQACARRPCRPRHAELSSACGLGTVLLGAMRRQAQLAPSGRTPERSHQAPRCPRTIAWSKTWKYTGGPTFSVDLAGALPATSPGAQKAALKRRAKARSAH